MQMWPMRKAQTDISQPRTRRWTRSLRIRAPPTTQLTQPRLMRARMLVPATKSGQEAASDNDNETSSISAAVSAVGVITWRTNRTTSRLERALDNASSAIHAVSHAYASVFALSDEICRNHPSHAVRARRASNYSAAVHIQAHAISTATRAVSALQECTDGRHNALDHTRRI